MPYTDEFYLKEAYKISNYYYGVLNMVIEEYRHCSSRRHHQPCKCLLCPRKIKRNGINGIKKVFAAGKKTRT